MSAKEAQAAGIYFYELPNQLNYDTVDPLIRDVCHSINESGWVWTAESCQGHPDADYAFPRAGNTKPMLRLVCREPDAGEMLNSLLAACGANTDRDVHHPILLEVCELSRQNGWVPIIVYARACTTYERNQGIAVYRRFAANLR